jgi:D-amino peptidase
VKVYLSVDMEGIAGIAAAEPTRRGDANYPASVELMVGETNAAIEGAFAGGATDVVVNDSHGEMFNLPAAAVDRRARLLVGTKPWSMVEGADSGGFGVALFVGYHARAGHPRGTLGHTYSSDLTLVTLQGRPVGEYGLNALALGAWGIPVGLVAGDDALAEEVAGWLPEAERVVVKRAVGQRAAESVHPEMARELIRDAAARVVERAGAPDARTRFPPFRPDPPITWTAEFRMPGQADFAAILPGVTREGDRGLRYTADDALDAFRAFLGAMRLGGLVK